MAKTCKTSKQCAQEKADYIKGKMDSSAGDKFETTGYKPVPKTKQVK
jgi:hypothetical protein